MLKCVLAVILDFQVSLALRTYEGFICCPHASS